MCHHGRSAAGPVWESTADVQGGREPQIVDDQARVEFDREERQHRASIQTGGPFFLSGRGDRLILPPNPAASPRRRSALKGHHRIRPIRGINAAAGALVAPVRSTRGEPLVDFHLNPGEGRHAYRKGRFPMLRRDRQFSGLIEQVPKRWLRSEAHGSICVQEGQPNITAPQEQEGSSRRWFARCRGAVAIRSAVRIGAGITTCRSSSNSPGKCSAQPFREMPRLEGQSRRRSVSVHPCWWDTHLENVR
jgi:hypothetical protein